MPRSKPYQPAIDKLIALAKKAAVTKSAADKARAAFNNKYATANLEYELWRNHAHENTNYYWLEKSSKPYAQRNRSQFFATELEALVALRDKKVVMEEE